MATFYYIVSYHRQMLRSSHIVSCNIYVFIHIYVCVCLTAKINLPYRRTSTSYKHNLGQIDVWKKRNMLVIEHQLLTNEPKSMPLNISPTEDFVLTNFATSYGYFESFQILNGLLCHQSCLVGIIGGCKIHRMPLCGEQLWIPLWRSHSSSDLCDTKTNWHQIMFTK